MSDLESTSARGRMVERDLRRRGIVSEKVLDAMGRVPRELFVLPAFLDEAYDDAALPIACEQTISQPYMVALMTEALELSGAEKVLEIGAGSGYQTAVLAELAREVVSIERHKELYEKARETLARLGYTNITLVLGDGSRGYPELAPFDRILITAAAERCPPALFDQLAEGGLLVGPFGKPDCQTLEVHRKQQGQPKVESLTACRFVPLIVDEPNKR
jgi:protein-L-isoaspartate(D-aspartate) O-methyltransferase